jgi:hypothetical protein
MVTESQYYEIAQEKGLTLQQAEDFLNNLPIEWSLEMLSVTYVELSCEKYIANHYLKLESDRLKLPATSNDNEDIENDDDEDEYDLYNDIDS